MKRSIIFFSIIFLTFLAGKTQNIENENNQKAKIILYRPNVFQGSAVGLKINLNGTPLVKLKNASYFTYEVDPGDYIFSSKMESEAIINLKVESGKTYYIRGGINIGFWSGRPYLILVNNDDGESEIKNGNLTKQEFTTISINRPKSRLGIVIAGGVGFEGIPFFTTTDNEEVTLSTGGGFTVGIEGGHEISKYFDLGFNFQYHSSTLSKKLDNADASFTRTSFFVNPSLVIPIKGGDFMRFRLGPGIGMYFSPTMDVDGSKISGGNKFTWNYNSAFGLDLNLIFESNFSEHGSYFMGIRYSSVKYQFSDSESNYVPYESEEKVYKPDGSGLNFLIGFSYNF